MFCGVLGSSEKGVLFLKDSQNQGWHCHTPVRWITWAAVQHIFPSCVAFRLEVRTALSNWSFKWLSKNHASAHRVTMMEFSYYSLWKNLPPPGCVERCVRRCVGTLSKTLCKEKWRCVRRCVRQVSVHQLIQQTVAGACTGLPFVDMSSLFGPNQR